MDTKRKVEEIISEVLEISPDDIPSGGDLPERLSLDSLLVLEILTRIEEEFAIDVMVEDVIGLLDSVEGVAGYIDSTTRS